MKNYERFFNETTTKAITSDYNEYEEIEVTQSLDEDNVTIIEQKKQGLISKAIGGVKNLFKRNKNSENTEAPVEETAEGPDKDKEE